MFEGVLKKAHYVILRRHLSAFLKGLVKPSNVEISVFLKNLTSWSKTDRLSIPMMHSMVLGILQGLTEFLPVSSSAHLILFPRYLGWQDPGLAFDVALHLGTLVGVVLYYWKDLWRMVTAVLNSSDPALRPERQTVWYLVLATIPGAIAGLLLEHKAETVFRSASLIAWALILLGIVLALADRFCTGQKGISDLTVPAALGIGLAQGLALIPGVSRSGITITVALALGFRRDEAARFSFLMSIPLIAGAGLLKFKEILLSPDKAALAAGFVSAAVAGYFAIALLIRYVQTRRYTPFVLYRWALGAFVLTHLARFVG
jgi:undecaprenyl-diphosphatase